MPEEAVQAAEDAAENTESTLAEQTSETPTETAAEAETPAISQPEATASQPEPAVEETPVDEEDVHYQAVEKEGTVTAIWEMQGQKHIRTIDPRSNEGKQILALFETAA